MTGPVARINLDALRQNLMRVRSAAPGCQVMAVVKANAYGHGALEVSDVLVKAGADALAVARVEEGLSLRRAGVEHRVILLEGPASPTELSLALSGAFELVIHCEEQIAWLERILSGSAVGVRCWLKVDSGMNRLGFSPETAKSGLERLGRIQGVVVAGLMTHFASADDRADAMTERQIHRFENCCTGFQPVVSMANSAAILGWPGSHGDWVRPGIMLYGASPFGDSTAEAEGLVPAMTLRTRLIAVKSCRKGETVGYGGTWRCPNDMMIGVAAIGYGDGYPRHALPGTPVLVAGRRTALVGRVSMDMIVVDLRDLPGARMGDPVVLWGDGLPVEEVAKAANTISYELFCRLTRRVKFRYEDSTVEKEV